MTIVKKYLDRIKECERDMSSDDSPCIYRGESECYPRVSSSLYRYYEAHFGPEWERLEECEKGEILKSNDSLDEQILAKRSSDIQHLGGATNWIDFTSESRVALFFACFGEYRGRQSNKVGRIIVAKESAFGKNRLEKPCGSYVNCLQKSVLVRPENDGVIDIKKSQGIKFVKILPRDKLDILMELGSEEHGSMSYQSLYSLPDEIFGHLRLQDRFLSPIVREEVMWGEKETLVKRAIEKNRFLWAMRLNPTPRISIWLLPKDEETRNREYFEGTGWHKVACDEPPFSMDDLPNILPPSADAANISKRSKDLVPPITGIMIISKCQWGSVHDDLCRAHKEKQLVQVKQSWQWKDGPFREEILQGRITNISSRKVTFQFDARCSKQGGIYD